MKGEKKHLLKLLSNGAIELRCIDKHSPMAKKQGRAIIWSGQYDDYEAMKAAILQAEKKGFDTYSTINPTKIPATNLPLEPFKRTTRDADVISIRTLFFDFDPVRDKDTPATDDQIDLAMDQAGACMDFLTNEGWGVPTIGFSGNGSHLLYHTVLDIEHAGKMAGLYKALQKRFSTDEIEFDVTVKNPARIARVLGTINRKAARRGYCIHSDDSTDGETILATVARLTPKPKNTWVKPVGHGEQVYVQGNELFRRVQAAGLIIKEVENGKYWVKCINEQSHGHTGMTDTVVWHDGRNFTYHCSHNGCSHIDAKALASMI